MPITTTYLFTRSSYSDHHPGLGIRLANAVSYHVFDGSGEIAGLVTNGRKTIAQFYGEGRLVMDSASSLSTTIKRSFTKEDGLPFADIVIKRPFWSEDQYQIRFHHEEGNDTFRYRNAKPGADNAFLYFTAELIKGEQTLCAIKNYQVKKRFYNPRTRNLEGTIELYKGTEKEKAFVLMQALQLYFELDTI